MANFLDLSREIRDIIYTHALPAGHVLIAKNEIYPDPPWGLIDFSIPVALLQVNKQVNKEATEIFLAQNTFKASLCAALGRPSVFTTHAKLFRNVASKLTYGSHLIDGEWEYLGKDVDCLISMWKQQMRELGSMTNLRCVQLDISCLVVVVYNPGDVRKDIPIWALLRELLTSLPQGVWKKEGLEDRGIWITGIFNPRGRNEMHEMGEACRDLGLNFMTEDGRRCGIPPGSFQGDWLMSDLYWVQKYYYG